MADCYTPSFQTGSKYKKWKRGKVKGADADEDTEQGGSIGAKGSFRNRAIGRCAGGDNLLCKQPVSMPWGDAG